MRPAAQSQVIDGAPPAQRDGDDVVELQHPGAPTTVAVGRAPGAPAAVPSPPLAAHRGGDGLALPRRSSRLLRRLGALPLPRGLDRAAALAVLLERALHRLAEEGAVVAAPDLVGEERPELVEVLLQLGIDRGAQRIGVGVDGLERGAGRGGIPRRWSLRRARLRRRRFAPRRLSRGRLMV
jgi:hypothetical protein